MSTKSGQTPSKKSSKSTAETPKSKGTPAKSPKSATKSTSSKESTSAPKIDVGEHHLVNMQQVFRASRALKTHVTNLKSQSTGKTQLIASESPVTVEILLHKVPISGNMKRKVIPLVKPIRDKKATEICVFVRDAKIAKEKLNSASAPNIKKVIALNKLRTHYNQYEARRVLAQSYDLFLCESTILPDVCRQLGTSFLRIRKAPVAIKISVNSADQIATIRDSALFELSSGVTQSYKIGDTGFTEEELCKNFAASIDKVVKLLPLGWSNVKQISLITAHCAPLPVYNNITVPTTKVTSEATSSDAADKSTGTKKTVASPSTAKGKRPAPENVEEDVSAPSPKKAKTTENGKATPKAITTPAKSVKSEKSTPSKPASDAKSTKTSTPKKTETPAKVATPKAEEKPVAKSPKTPKTPAATKKSTEETKTKTTTPKKSETPVKAATPKSAEKPAAASPKTPKSASKSETTPKSTGKSTPAPVAKSTPKSTTKSAPKTATPKASPATKKATTPASAKKK